MNFWRGRRVFLTGHTGFKGSWLSLMFSRLGARVWGYALPPEDERGLFVAGGVQRHIQSQFADIRDFSALKQAIAAAQPEIIFHLAAQALVLPSYQAPLDTFAINVMGTANVLEASRSVPGVRAVLVVTSDKVYSNQEWVWGYREDDQLGGRDPYSSSKACAELVAASYRASFLAEQGIALATARAGNVIGGGDWAANRIVPDFVRAMAEGKTLRVRNPASTRPWQHLLEPLEGYLLLAQRLATQGNGTEGAWNFGPLAEAVQPVGRLADDLVRCWGDGANWAHEGINQPHEASILTLDSTKARQKLGWQPRLGYSRGVQLTIDWYKSFVAGSAAEALTLAQIDQYMHCLNDR